MSKSLLNALEVAKRYIDQPKLLCAVLYKNKHIYAIGINSTLYRKQTFNNKVYMPSVHAEIDAIIKAYNNYVRIHRKPLYCNMVIIRYIGCSKPCLNCLKIMKNSSFQIFINKVSYIEDGMLKTEKLSEMTTDHISRGYLNKQNAWISSNTYRY